MTALYTHVSDLVDRADYIFLPFYLDKKGRNKGPRRQYCYYSQFAPSLTTYAAGQQNHKKFIKSTPAATMACTWCCWAGLIMC